MPAEVETMFYAREVPWHGLGTRVEQALSSEEAIKMAGLEWEVFNAPLKALIKRGKKITEVDVPDRVANIRSSDNSVLGVVSDDYRIVQNKDAFEFTDNLLGGKKHVKYETAGSLFEGRRVWLLAKMDGIKVLGDSVDPYLVFTNSHDRSTGIRIAITPVRVVCNNTLTLAVENAVRIWSTTHTGNIQEKLYEAQETLRKVNVYLENFPKMAQTLVDTNIYIDETEQILEELFPTPIPEKQGETRMANIERKKNAVYTLWTETPDIEKFQGTAWGLYNALSDYVGHVKANRETENWQEYRFAKIAEGHPLLEKAQAILLKVRQ